MARISFSLRSFTPIFSVLYRDAKPTVVYLGDESPAFPPGWLGTVAIKFRESLKASKARGAKSRDQAVQFAYSPMPPPETDDHTAARFGVERPAVLLLAPKKGAGGSYCPESGPKQA